MILSFQNKTPQIDPSCFIAPNATIIGSVAIGKDSSVWFQAVLRGDYDSIYIGDRVNVQDGTVCHTDEGIPLLVSDEVTIGHNVILHGCVIGKGSLIGMGSIIMNKARIGEDSLVAAGSLVTEGKQFPPRSLIMGTPAKVVRELSEEEIIQMHSNAMHYVENGKNYKAQMESS